MKRQPNLKVKTIEDLSSDLKSFHNIETDVYNDIVNEIQKEIDKEIMKEMEEFVNYSLDSKLRSNWPEREFYIVKDVRPENLLPDYTVIIDNYIFVNIDSEDIPMKLNGSDVIDYIVGMVGESIITNSNI